MIPRPSFLPCRFVLLTSSLSLSLLFTIAQANAAPSHHERAADSSNPLNIDWDPAPAPEDGPPLSANALRDKSYLPAQVGAIVGAYAFSLVVVAITLLSLAKRRREHLKAGSDEIDFETKGKDVDHDLIIDPSALNTFGPDTVPNFSYPSPTKTEFDDHSRYIFPSPLASTSAPGVHPQVDQSIVAADKAMAQQQLEEMYKYVLEHEDAKQKGIAPELPDLPGSSIRSSGVGDKSSISEMSTRTSSSKKERTKPASLNLAAANEEQSQSRTSSFLSSLRSPKKKPQKGINISSPMMTPQSATFPRHDGQEMGGIPPRHYAPPPPPPVPMSESQHGGAPMTPDISPQSVQSIDERIAVQLDTSRAISHSRNISQAPTEYDPESATSATSRTPLVGLPASPRSSRGPSLPSSPKPGATFARPKQSSAVRTGGSLPLRAYEPSAASPTAQTTKQTVFERKGPLSPTTGRTPFTAGATPYSPYQPFTPVVPMTPSLVTREDRRRMKRLVPKTPTLEMVENSDEVW